MPQPNHDDYSSKIPNEDLLAVLLDHADYSHFCKFSDDDYRDPQEKNSSLSLSTKGCFDHKTGESSSLFNLAKQRDLLKEARHRSGLSTTTSKNGQHKTDTSQKAGELWDKAHATAEAAHHIRDYLTEHRNIPSENYQDLIDSGHLRWSLGYKEYPPALVYPFHYVEDNHSIRDKIRKIHVTRKEPYRNKRKRALGSDGHLTILPPLTSTSTSGYLAMEGLEDALSVRGKHPDKTIVVASSKVNFEHLEHLLKSEDQLLIIADNDDEKKPDGGQNSGQVVAAKVCQTLRQKGVDAKAMMPPEPKDDANQALQEGKLDQWLESLVDVPQAPIIQSTDFDIELVKGEQIPTLSKGILPSDLETYLQLVAESLTLNYEAAFCEFLVNASIAIGGHKQIVIEVNWQEKAVLWLASIGKSGMGKTPLSRECGSKCLEEQQKEWHLQFKHELEEWQHQDDGKMLKPVRKRWMVNSITLETLCALHEQNPAGIGISSDEIIGVLNGLNQYKGKGNDKQKLVTIFNGHSLENPTADSDRYIPNVFVPISGGIQEALVRKIINDSNTTDGLAGRFLFNHLLLQPVLTVEEKRKIYDLIARSKGKDILTGIFHKLASVRDQSNQVLMNHYARDHLANYAHHLELEQRKGSDQAAAAYAKLRTYTYRIALLLHYVSESKPDEHELSELTAINTVKVMRFFVANMKRAYGSVELTDKERKARAILDKLQQLGGRAKHDEVKQPIKRTVPSKEASELIKELIGCNQLREVIDGRSKLIELVKK